MQVNIPVRDYIHIYPVLLKPMLNLIVDMIAWLCAVSKCVPSAEAVALFTSCKGMAVRKPNYLPVYRYLKQYFLIGPSFAYIIICHHSQGSNGT